MHPDDPDISALQEAVLAAMPGWSFSAGPEGFGWAPRRHLRARLAGDGRIRDVVIKHCWAEGTGVETFMYRSVLPLLRLRTPQLVAAFTTDSGREQWLVLEDVGEMTLDATIARDRCAFLRLLGTLHGQGATLVAHQPDLLRPLPWFADAAVATSAEWSRLLTDAARTGHYGVEKWMVSVNDALWVALTREPATLLHGDANVSNAVVAQDRVALLDWERAQMGPPPIDLGRSLDTRDSPDGLAAYADAFNAETEGRLPDELLRRWANLGRAHNGLRWICHYIREAGRGNRPSDEWRRENYEPCLGWIRALRDRRPDWL